MESFQTVIGVKILNRELADDLTSLVRGANSTAITSIIFSDPWTVIYEMIRRKGEPDDFLLDVENELNSLRRLLTILKKRHHDIPHDRVSQMLQGVVGYTEFLTCYTKDIAQRGYMDAEHRAKLSQREKAILESAGRLFSKT